VIFDDVGSYPLAKGITKEWVKKAFFLNQKQGYAEYELHKLVEDAMGQKINAGVEVPNYPQFQDMVAQFRHPIMDEDKTEEPWLIKEEEAKIMEMEFVEEVAKQYEEDKGEKLNLRICVTGPIELYYSQFPPPVYMDVLSNIAKSVGRFIQNAIGRGKHCEVKTVSIDEPSMGIDPRIEEEGIITALEIASAPAHVHSHGHKKKIDVQIHLHSPVFYSTISQVEGVTVIGMESAANPSLLRLISKKELERDDKYLRIGIARTDIYKMAAEFNERHHTNVFKEKEMFKELINEYNSKEEIMNRLEKAYAIFGDRIKYAGPDCGLGSFPSQETAYLLLKNTSAGISISKHQRR
jgi:5-methyltetrahydropteroyltriglutamate--homocysteine methyltransferase